ncbi:class I adenylate-forming enzyme family protein [Acinetobacter sp. ANC 4169]|jgi:long-chain acyl-CoA synthetase|uniref:class I adenylate-forming enzyme family protein n=1 Tax=Acinetobacter sp. ANC 4169 TaxID=1977879 RepID=UPI00148A3236|nr:class I adenylate-forming enzyme family protein [Acinetobacter sp. ANC 4169]
MDNIYKRFHQTAIRLPNKCAIRYEQRSIDYQNLLQAVERVGKQFEQANLIPGTVIALYCDNTIEYIVAYLAAARNQLVLATLDVRYTDAELAAIVAESRPEYILVEKDRPFVHSVSAGLESGHIIEVQDDLSLFLIPLNHQLPRHPELTPTDFIIQYSSGSTGTPKGIRLSQYGLINKLENWIATLSILEDDVLLNTLTLSHCYGMYVHTLTALFSGATVVMLNLAMLTPRRIATTIEEQGVTVFGSLPYMYQLLADLPQNYQPDFTQVRYFISGSAPLNEKTAKDFMLRFNRPINQVFGLTEIGLITFNRNVNDVMSTGCLTANMEARIINAQGEDVAEGEVGELLVRCASMANGYLGHSEEEKNNFVDGWLHTQDFVYRSNDYFYVAGRKSHFINVGGNKVSPVEIEACLTTHPAVKEAAVAGINDDYTGEQIIAFVVMAHPATSSELLVHCRAYLAAYKVPTRIIQVSSIPKSPLGKILKKNLLEDWLRESNQSVQKV